jgi:hypothetical protein
MMIISKVYFLRYSELREGKRHTPWQEYMNYLRQFLPIDNGGEFQQLDSGSILRHHYFRLYNFQDVNVTHFYLRVLIFLGVILNRFFLHLLAGLFYFYHPYCHDEYQEINDLDCSKAYCHNDDKQTILQELAHKLIPRKHDGKFRVYHQSLFGRIYRTLLSIPSILSRYKIYWISLCLLFPRIDLNLFLLYFAYQHLLIRCWSFPWAFPRRRDLCLLDYNMGGI